MSEHILIAALKYIALEILWDVLYFPVWWYSKGLARVANYSFTGIAFYVRRQLALGVWLQHMFTPMYGDYTKEGRIISFFMRLVVLVGKLMAAVFVTIWYVLLLLLWAAMPLVFVYYILYQVFRVEFKLFELF